jgi:hypothetical protein
VRASCSERFARPGGTLVRALVEHLAAFGYIPPVTVFDRPKTIALKWGRDGSAPAPEGAVRGFNDQRTGRAIGQAMLEP